jgi:hypothetical protein
VPMTCSKNWSIIPSFPKTAISVSLSSTSGFLSAWRCGCMLFMRGDSDCDFEAMRDGVLVEYASGALLVISVKGLDWGSLEVDGGIEKMGG